MRRIGLICFLLWIGAAWLCPNQTEAASGRRVALVIGNGAYKDSPLNNPVNDARDIAGLLGQLGFEVILEENADRRAMIEAVDRFADKIPGADAALFYFAGHGLQVRGRNYLLPINYHIVTETDVEIESLDAYRVLGKMEGPGDRVNIVILDACRNNPFARKFRTPTQGLARLDAPRGTILAYATDPDNTALDGKGRNSPYTEALKKYLTEPGLSVEQVFKKVRQEVIAKTGGKQTPWETTSLIGDFYFVPTSTIAAPSAPARIDFQDLQQEAATRGKWSEWQTAMTQAWSQVEALEKDPALSSAQKAEAWARFLAAYTDDNPFSQDDESLRAKAFDRMAYWDREQHVALAPPPAADETFTNSIGQKFVLVPAGTFMMGSPPNESGRNSEETQHQVTISRPFYLQTTEVTQGQWRAVMGKNPSNFSICGDDCPVENVSWHDAQEFIRRLNAKEGLNKYRLPTEAEWEYACRAGRTTAFYFGDDGRFLGEYAWYDGNSGKRTQPVGRKKSNPWGLYDLHGNVWEWCADWFGDYPPGSVTDPTGPSSGSYRVFRGGGWPFDAKLCRSAVRGRRSPNYRAGGLGFRLARTP